MARERNYAAMAGVTNSSRRTDSDGRSQGESMSDDDLLTLLQRYEDDSAEYTDTTLREVRDSSIKAYFQRPYGNEEPGWSQAITSTVADTVGWMQPDLMDLFISTDDAVRFDPRRQEEVKSAQAATDGCNYIFWQQNNGFLILHNAIWDALVLRTCAIHARIEEKRIRRQEVFTGPDLISTMVRSGAAYDESVKVLQVEEVPGPMVPAPAMPGQPPGAPQQLVPGPAMVRVRVEKVELQRRVRVDSFEPENLRVARGWNSPLLDECPYVARDLEISLSDLNELCRQLGVDEVTADELKASQEPQSTDGDILRMDRTGDGSADAFRRRDNAEVDSMDESQTMGWLRIEWVRADFDGDGIAELREVYRLDNLILSNEECDAIPCVTGSPLLVPHKWDGQSIAETLEDLQLIHTDLLRGVLNNAYNANNPRKVVLTDKHGATAANMDDLLDSNPGGYIRTTNMDGVRMEPTAYVGNDFMPLFDMIDNQTEKRSGVTRQRMGMDPNAINNDRTLGETRIMDQASKQRIKLIGRSIAEVIMKPLFKIILKLATSGKVDPLFFKLRGEFVEIDPNEWLDGYDMSTNVGLGTGDKESQEMALEREFQTQMSLMATPLVTVAGMITPEQIYNTRTKLLSLRGFKNAADFYTKPKPGPLPPAPQQPPVELLVAQEKAKTEAQRFQAESRQEYERARMEQEAKTREMLQQNEIQRQNDQRDHERELAKIEADRQVEFERLRLADEQNKRDNRTRLLVAQIGAKSKGVDTDGETLEPETAASVDPDDDIRQGIAAIIEHQRAPATIVYGLDGRPAGVQKGEQFRPAVRDESGNIVGLQ